MLTSGVLECQNSNATCLILVFNLVHRRAVKGKCVNRVWKVVRLTVTELQLQSVYFLSNRLLEPWAFVCRIMGHQTMAFRSDRTFFVLLGFCNKGPSDQMPLFHLMMALDEESVAVQLLQFIIKGR